MRWTLKASGAELDGRAGSSGLVNFPTKRQTNDAFADGEVVWFWRPLLASRGEPVIQIRMPDTSTRR
jgi:hypothetical protein